MKEIQINFKCPHQGCDKQFSYQSHFERHLKIHTQQRNYTCVICQKSFKRKDALTIHENKHKKEEDKPYQCLYANCTKKFPSKSGLRYHMLKHEENLVYQCSEQNCQKNFLTLGQLNQHQFLTKQHQTCHHEGLSTQTQEKYYCTHGESPAPGYPKQQHFESYVSNDEEDQYRFSLRMSDLSIKMESQLAFRVGRGEDEDEEGEGEKDEAKDGREEEERNRLSFPRESHNGAGQENERVSEGSLNLLNLSNFQNGLGTSLSMLEDTPFGMLKKQLEFVVGCVEDMKKQETLIVDQKIKTAVHFFSQLRNSGGNQAGGISFDMNEIEEGRSSFEFKQANAAVSSGPFACFEYKEPRIRSSLDSKDGGGGGCEEKMRKSMNFSLQNNFIDSCYADDAQNNFVSNYFTNDDYPSMQY